MAKQYNGIYGGYRGAVGPVIGYQWRGRWCLRARPLFVHNPRTEAQQRNRHQFAATVQLASRLKEVLRMGFHARAMEAHITEANLFIHSNLGRFGWTDESLSVDYSRLLVSDGPLAPVGFDAPQIDATGHITVCYERNPLKLRADSNDMVYLYAYCPEAGEGLLSLPFRRCQRRAEMQLPRAWQGCEVMLYGFVQDRHQRCSRSAFLAPEPATGLLFPSTEHVENTTQYAPLHPVIQNVASEALPQLPAAGRGQPRQVP